MGEHAYLSNGSGKIAQKSVRSLLCAPHGWSENEVMTSPCGVSQWKCIFEKVAVM